MAEETLENIAYENGLDLIETTCEMNGYPSQLKYAIIGFETYSEASELADKYDLSIEHFRKRDGWQLWYRNGNTADSEYQLSSDDFGPNDLLFYKSDIATFQEDEIDAFIDDYEDEEEREDFINDKMYILENLRSMDSDEAVLTEDGRFSRIVKTRTMSYTEDVYTYAIGLIERS